MKKLLLLTKMLLAAVLLCVGQNAWGGILSPSAGNVDNSTAWNTWDEGFTQNFTMSGNSTASFTFHYTSDPTASDYAGWTMFIGKTINTTNVWDTWISCRGYDGTYYGADGLGGTRASSNTYAGTLSAASCTEADVTVTITRTAENITAVAAVDPTNGDDDYTITWTYTYGGSDVVNGDLYISFAVEKAYLNITNVTGSNVITTTQADIDFTKDVADGAIAGTLNSISVVSGTTTATEKNSTNNSLKLGKSTSTVTIPAAIRAGSRDKVTISFDLAYGKLMNKSVFFNAKDASGNLIFDETYNVYSNSFSANTLDISGDDFYHANNTVIWARRATYTIVIDYATNKINTSVKNNFGGGVVNHEVVLSNSNPVATFNVGSDYDSNADRRCEVSNIKITTTLGDYSVSEVDYTINYKLDDNVVKSVSSTGMVDQVITADAAIDGTEEGYVGNHYLITAAKAPSMTLVDGDNILNVPVRAPYTATLTVTKNIGGEAQTPEVTNLVETDAKVCSWIYAYPMYIKKGDVYYIADVTSAFGETGNFTDGQSISKTVNYTATAPDVVWFKDIDGATLSNVAYSGGGYTNINEELANVTVDAGIYEVIFNVVSKAGNGSNHRNEGVSVNGENVANLTGNVNGLRSLIINVANDESVITAYGNGSSSYTDNLDYVIIKKLPSTVSATIGANGFTTFASPYPLDLTSATQTANSFKAYRASAVNDETVTFKDDVNQNVQANTGVLLKGAANAVVSIPVVASGSALADNALKVNAAGTTFDAAANTTYYGMNKGSDPLTFGTFDPSSVAIPANKAYLALTSIAAREVRVVFGDITGVANVEAAAEAKAKEGKFIENGKLVIVKNGQKFNAAGAKLY